MTDGPRHPTVRLVSSEQRHRLAELHVGVDLGAPAAAVQRQLVDEVARILDAGVALLARTNAGWRVCTESPGQAFSHGWRDAQATVADRLLEWSSSPGNITAATVGGVLWTMVKVPGLRRLRPIVLVVQGDWTLSSQALFLAVRNIAFVTRICKLSSRARLSATLQQLGRRVTRVRGLAQVCDAILERITRAVRARQGSLAVADPDSRQLSIKATVGYPLALVQHLRIDPGVGIIGAAYKSGAPLRIADVQTLPGRQRPRPRYRTKSCLIVPIKAGREVLGVLSVTDQVEGRDFTADDLATLRALAGPAALVLAREIAVQQVEDYAHAAAVDPVSGLFNRRYFEVRIDEEFERARRHHLPLALLMIDIDDFKVVNDSFGHLAGDAVLRKTAEILRRSVRVFDICTRFGGDEFAILMPGSGAEPAAKIAERVRGYIEQSRMLEAMEAAPHVTVSVGLAVSSADMPPHELVARADRALYLAKRGGKNRVYQLDPGEPS